MKALTSVAAVAATVFSLAIPAQALDFTDGGRLRVGDCETYYLNFWRGDDVYISLEGDGRADLDIEVYDTNGNIIASSASPYSNEEVWFTARRDGEYTVVIYNREGATSAFDMWTEIADGSDCYSC